MKLIIGARDSPLSRAQVREVLEHIRCVEPTLEFDPIWVKTKGDLDKQTSLRALGKSDFFTHEIDRLVQSGLARLGIHSAKDLPDPLPVGLCIAFLTESIDSRDTLVLREKQTLEDLKIGAWIATSSERREEAVRMLRKDLRFQDLRGTIDERLQKLFSKEVDGVVVAEAALIRLKLTHLNRVYLPGPTAEGQGKLAILSRQNDREMIELFRRA